MEATPGNNIEIKVEIQGNTFRVLYDDILIIISNIGKERWLYDFYKSIDIYDNTQMNSVCAPFECQGLPWIQSRHKDSLLTKSLMKVLFSEKEEAQKLAQDITEKIYGISDDYIETHQHIPSEEQKEQEEIVPEDIHNEAEKIVNSGKALQHIVDYLGYEILGEIPQKKLTVLSLGALGLSEISEAPHQHVWGEPEVGKSIMYKGIKLIMPKKLVYHADSFSPKALFYFNVKARKLIVINDAIIDEDLGKYLNNGCDTTAWKYGFEHDTVINHEGRSLSIPPGLLYFISTNLPLDAYKVENVSLDATATRFYSTEKSYTDEQKKAIQKFLFELKLPENYERIKQVVKEILNILLSEPKNVKQIEGWENIEKIIPVGLRSSQRIYTLFRCNALFRNSNKVEKIDIEEIAKLMNEISPDDVKTTKDTPLILDNLPCEETLKGWDLNKSENLKIAHDICGRDGLSNRLGFKKETMWNRLSSLYKKGLIGSIKNPKNSKENFYFKLKEKTDSNTIKKLLGTQTITPEMSETGILQF